MAEYASRGNMKFNVTVGTYKAQEALRDTIAKAVRDAARRHRWGGDDA